MTSKEHVISTNQSSRWAGVVRVIQFALIGALAFSVTPLTPENLYQFGPGKCAECGGVLAMLGIVLMTSANMIQEPWGLIGALVGAVIGWLTIRARRVQHQRKAEE